MVAGLAWQVYFLKNREANRTLHLKYREKMNSTPNRKQRFVIYTLCGFLAVLVVVGLYNVFKPLPAGLSFAGPRRDVRHIRFLNDITWADAEGRNHSKQEIFDTALSMIRQAKKLILLDMFLFNDFMGNDQAPYRKLSHEISEALIIQKKNHPEITITIITDPINTVYGSIENSYFNKMTNQGINVTETRLVRLRDSNPMYSVFWRLFAQPFGAGGPGNMLPSPFGRGRVSLLSYLSMLNFKTNHRKTLICDSGEDYAALVTSANPHDGSSAHGNIGVYFKGQASLDLLQSEAAVLAFSEGAQPLQYDLPNDEPTSSSGLTVQVLTESKIKEALLAALNQAGSGDHVSVVVFYLADRDVIAAITDAGKRGSRVRVQLDPNKDAFGRTKNGIPNRQVARELVQDNIPVRWSNTHGEQSHAKLLLVQYDDGRSTAILGSANFTRRNLSDLNLETDVAVRGNSDAQFFADADQYVNQMWNNSIGQNLSLEYEQFADKSFHKGLLYRWMEATGMSTF
jgi:phosphatidylserine/phosphatidylglycerophosphate/cardiolipin synthase-like enzyme